LQAQQLNLRLLKADKTQEKTWGKKEERKRGYRMKVCALISSILRLMDEGMFTSIIYIP
jgi:hypothetical protein